MRKIDPRYENFFDDILIDISEKVAPAFKKLNFTPNDITSLSNISMCITLLLLLQLKYYWASLFLIISHFFDCLDGCFARTYNQVTELGDKYDHFSDTIKHISLLSLLYILNPTKFMNIIPIVIVFFILAMMHLGYQELLYDKDESHTLSYLKLLCITNNSKDKETIKKELLKSKYFGCGTFELILVIVLIYYAEP